MIRTSFNSFVNGLRREIRWNSHILSQLNRVNNFHCKDWVRYYKPQTVPDDLKD